MLTQTNGMVVHIDTFGVGEAGTGKEDEDQRNSRNKLSERHLLGDNFDRGPARNAVNEQAQKPDSMT